MPLYDCQCIFGHKFEKLLKMSEVGFILKCPECGEAAKTVISPVRSKLDGTDPSLPGAYIKWGEDRVKRAAKKKANTQA